MSLQFINLNKKEINKLKKNLGDKNISNTDLICKALVLLEIAIDMSEDGIILIGEGSKQVQVKLF